MRSRAILVLSLLAASASACTWSDAPSPEFLAVRPAEAPTHLDVELRLEGRDFEPIVRADFDDPDRSPVDAGFAVTLVAGGDRIPLSAVAPLSRTELRATLMAGAPEGTYAVEVRDPRGRVAILPGAFDLFVPEPGCEVEGAACEDGDLCTQGDSCVLGRCTRGTPITCTASDACHDVGVCDPGTGLCSDPAALDGTTCVDGDACTQVDTCQAGACTGASPVVCTALDQCHDVGVCDPGTGLCSDPAALDGTTCVDGDACTQTDTCQSGVCYGQDPIVCVESDPCHLAGTCDPGSGLCSDPPAPDGTPCTKVCPSLDQCKDAVCTEVIGICVNTAPLAQLVVSPGGGTAGVTHFTLDASGSTDAETPTTLQFRFDSDGNGEWSGWSSTPTHLQTYAAPGVYTAAVQVRDAAVGGLTSYATILVVVAAPGDEVKVTTALDERDTGATPASPGGTGLSLREAITWVNDPTTPTPKTITLAAPLTITMTGAQRVLRLTAAGAAVVAEAGVVLDFAGFNQACFRLDGPGQRLLGATLVGCDSVFIDMTTISQGSQVAQVTVVGVGRSAVGVDAQAASAPTSRIGPGNDLSGLSTALNVMGTDYEVVGNQVHASAIGARLNGFRALVLQNVFYGQVGSPPLEGSGIRLYAGDGPVEILQNVFDRNAVHGVQADGVTALTIRNNLFTGNGAYGLDAAAGLTYGYNGYFGNGTGTVTSNLSTDATDVLADPLFVDGPSGDFRLLPQSPAIDKGFDTLRDVNGPLPGQYTGLAPDLGAVEMK